MYIMTIAIYFKLLHITMFVYTKFPILFLLGTCTSSFFVNFDWSVLMFCLEQFLTTFEI